MSLFPKTWGMQRLMGRHSYLFHPFTLGAALARSTSVFNNLFVSLAIASSIEGTSFQVQLTLYKVLT